VDKIDRGRIVWLTNVFDSRGKPTDDHRAVILTTKTDYEAEKPIQAVHISSKRNYTSDDCMVKLPHAKGGHPQTGLNRPSWAICDWPNKDVDIGDITDYGNLIYGIILEEIMMKAEPSLRESTQS
jgi:hypothetical protein